MYRRKIMRKDFLPSARLHFSQKFQNFNEIYRCETVKYLSSIPVILINIIPLCILQACIPFNTL